MPEKPDSQTTNDRPLAAPPGSPKPFPAATPSQLCSGWKCGYAEMQRLTDILAAEYDEDVTMEQMDSVIQCLAANGYLRLENTQVEQRHV